MDFIIRLSTARVKNLLAPSVPVHIYCKNYQFDVLKCVNCLSLKENTKAENMCVLRHKQSKHKVKSDVFGQAS